MPRPSTTSPTSRCAGAVAATFSSASRPTKSPGLVELDDPPEPGVVRVRVAVELVAVERHPRLEPQGVARAEPDRQPAAARTAVEQDVPQLDGPRRCRRRPRTRPRPCSRSARRAPGCRRPCPRRRRSSAGRRGRRRSAARAISTARGPLDREQAGRERAVVEDGREPARAARPARPTRPARCPRWRRRGSGPRRGGRRSGRR